MAQVFHPSTNTLAKVSIFGALFFLAALAWGAALIDRSGYVTGAGIARSQPVPFSHKHHSAQLGIDCRYCHTTVENAAYANVPPTKTCISCHKEIWAESPMLEPVRESFRTGKSLQWIRVHDLPDFVYFDHGVHVQKGVGCVTCHGRVDEMNLTWQESSLKMEWCLDCHRQPERYVRPREEVFNADWQPPVDQETLGRQLVAEYQIEDRLADCSICHR